MKTIKSENIKEFINSNNFDKNNYQDNEKLRIDFINDYSLNEIKYMNIDDYAIGKGNKNSFCNRLENGLDSHGRISGALPSRFGLYYAKNGELEITKKFGDNKEDVFNYIIQSIIELIKSGKKDNIIAINENIFSSTIKLKILSLYYPDKFINIFSREHLNYFLDKLNISYNRRTNDIEKNILLVNYKNSIPNTENISLYEFSRYLYYVYGRPAPNRWSGKKTEEEKLFEDELIEDELYNHVDIENIEIVDFDFTDYSSMIKPSKKTYQKVDFEKQNRISKKIGDLGEEIVMTIEKETAKHPENIIHQSKESDDYGFDILSNNKNGETIMIEVKSTTCKCDVNRFFISDNELNELNKSNNYWIYFVFEVSTRNPKVVKINSETLKEKGIHYEPIQYKFFLKFTEKND